MNKKTYGVHVIVDPDFGERLRTIHKGEPVWILDSKMNHPVIETIRSERKETKHTLGITSFIFDPDGTPQEWLIGILGAIDIHHNEFSHDPPYSWLNVIGTSYSEEIKEELEHFGFRDHDKTDEGFIVKKKEAPSNI